jgi:uncharacterized protein YeaO (DUF488 family)
MSTTRKHTAEVRREAPDAWSQHRSRPCFLHKVGADGVSPGALDLRTKRIDAPRESADGRRVLVSRFWPRGIRKQEAALDEWSKDLAPSTELQQWFGHDPTRWPEFRVRYRAELMQRQRLLNSLRRSAAQQPVTLLYAARDCELNAVTVLKEVICAQ